MLEKWPKPSDADRAGASRPRPAIAVILKQRLPPGMKVPRVVRSLPTPPPAKKAAADLRRNPPKGVTVPEGKVEAESKGDQTNSVSETLASEMYQYDGCNDS